MDCTMTMSRTTNDDSPNTDGSENEPPTLLMILLLLLFPGTAARVDIGTRQHPTAVRSSMALTTVASAVTRSDRRCKTATLPVCGVKSTTEASKQSPPRCVEFNGEELSAEKQRQDATNDPSLQAVLGAQPFEQQIVHCRRGCCGWSCHVMRSKASWD